jgi:divalent metal cation (Fe/Co/Zn/Cd) transporter
LSAFLRSKGSTSVWTAVLASKDPTIVAVLFEDSAALAGLVTAAICITVAHGLGMPELDGYASVVIGLLLCAVASLLLRKTKGLLVGEAARPEIVDSIREAADGEPAVRRTGRVLTMQLGPSEILVNIDLEFMSGLTVPEVARAVDRIEQRIREAQPDVRHIFLEAPSLKRTA